MPHPRFTRFACRLAAILLALALALAAGACRPASEWPRGFDSPAGTFVVYQPQPEDLKGNLLSGRMAFSLQKPGDGAPVFGVLWFRARVEVDRDSSLVGLREFDVTRVRLPGIQPDDAHRYELLVEAAAQAWDLSGRLVELRASLAANEREQLDVAGLDHTPPRILLAYRRTLLVSYDGAPVLEPIPGTTLERVTNTPFAVVHDPQPDAYYLAGQHVWYAAKDPLGPWSLTATPPANVVAAVPPDTSAGDTLQGEPPAILTATEPTELIAFDGDPLLAPLVGTRLFYVSNTESDVLRDASTRLVYVLIAGRWYSATTEEGPWTWVSADALPDVFREIPDTSPKAHLLASVAGTSQADDALADDEIPQTTAVRRDDHDLEVTWDGPPQFDLIPGCALQYGVNTDAEVVYDGRLYFVCDQGVWYVSEHADGPWDVSVVTPAGLESLPPECPVYNLRWADIYEVEPDVVYVGYLPGYLGYYPCGGTVVYGTGHRYKPWRGTHHFYPRFTTWGFQARYNPWLTRWSFGYSYGAAFLRIGTRWHLGGPRRHHSGDGAWFGPGGYRRPWLANDHSLLRTRRRSHARPDDPTPASLYSRAFNVDRVVKYKRPASAPPLPLRPLPGHGANDVFAGTDGNTYRRSVNGNWKVNKGQGWVPTVLPQSPPVRPSEPQPDRNPVTPAPIAVPAPRREPAPVPVAPANPPAENPRRPASPAPVAPAPANSPGSLEREFEARKRAAEQPSRPAAPEQRPAAPEKRPAEPAKPPADRSNQPKK